MRATGTVRTQSTNEVKSVLSLPALRYYLVRAEIKEGEITHRNKRKGNQIKNWVVKVFRIKEIRTGKLRCEIAYGLQQP